MSSSATDQSEDSPRGAATGEGMVGGSKRRRDRWIAEDAAYLIHDLKNPVNAIDLLAQTVLRDRGGSERGRAAAAKIRAETQTLLRMITSLLDIDRADHEPLVAVRREIDPRVLVSEVLDQQRSRADSVGITLVAAVRVIALCVDPDLFRRVLANLVDNAIRHAPEGTEVRLGIDAVTEGVDVRVSDAGPGVPAELRQAVFERFVRGDRGATRTNRGLGLTFCKLAVEAHGGRIWIEDRDPGTAFCIRIPVVRGHGSASRSRVEAAR